MAKTKKKPAAAPAAAAASEKPKANSGKPVYKRIMLKLSGEMLGGDSGRGIDTSRLTGFCREVKEVSNLGVQVAVVIGGGNIIRGVSAASQGMDRATADYMGMLAGVINGVALQPFSPA